MTTMYFTPRTVTEGQLTVRITKSGKWVNIDVINEYQRRVAGYGYNVVEKRWSYNDKPAADSLAWKILTTHPAEDEKPQRADEPAARVVNEPGTLTPMPRKITNVSGRRERGEVVLVVQKDGAVIAGIAGESIYDNDTFDYGHRGWYTEIHAAATEPEKAACREALSHDEQVRLNEARSRHLSLNNSLATDDLPPVEFQPGDITSRYDHAFTTLGGRA